MAHPHNLRRAIAEEHELMLEDDDSTLPKTGQQGFLDLSKAQDPIDLEEEPENVVEYEPTEPPGADEADPKEVEEMAATYQDECTSSGDESREVREMRRLDREEKRRREEETTEAADDDENEKIKGLRKPKKPIESPSKKRRKRKKKLEV